MRRFPSRSLSIVAVAALGALIFAAGCGADSDRTVEPRVDTQITSDIAISDTTQPADTTTPTADAVSPADARPDDDTGPSTSVKADPDFLVPAGVAARDHAAASGTRVAWVERAAPNALPRLMLWDLATPDLAPLAFAIPNLLNPRELALSADFLVYVDDRYGDPDIFALELASGAERAVVTEPGVQDAPTIARATVAWADCRRCVSGDDGANRDIYRAELPDGPAIAVTFDATPDRRPVFGTLADGALGLAWIRGESTLRVVAEGGELDASWPTDTPVGTLALTEGVLAWRPQPVIINPDSMIPSDLFLTTATSGETVSATFHAELSPVLPSAPRAAAGRIAWLESPPDDAGATLIKAIAAADRAVVVDREIGAVASGLALGASHLVITAPRPDNGGLVDVWALPLTPGP